MSSEPDAEALLRLLAEAGGTPGREQVVAIVRNAELFAQSEPSPETTPVCFPLVADLIIALAFDLPGRIQVLTHADLDSLGVSAEELFDEALQNVLGALQIERHQDGPLFTLSAGGDFEASLLLHVNLWEHLGGVVDGAVLASVPCRDVLLFTGAETEGGEAALRERTAALFDEGSYAVSKAILRFSGAGWVEQDVS